MEEQIRFDIPTQVMFRAFEGGDADWYAGIGYHDEIICACCGGIFEIGELAAIAAEDGVEQFIFPYEDWVDLTEEITGYGSPEGFPLDEIPT